MKSGCQIPWNVTVICGTDGRHLTNGVLEKTFGGQTHPFRSMVENHPVPAIDQSRLHQFGKKVLLDIFAGHVFYAEGIWKGDILVADIEELEDLGASEIHAQRLNTKEVLMPKVVTHVCSLSQIERSS